MGKTEGAVYTIAGYKVRCERGVFESPSDKRAKVTVGSRERPETKAILELIQTLVMRRCSGGDYSNSAVNCATFHDCYPTDNEKPPVDFPEVCKTLDMLSKELPYRLPLHQLEVRLRQIERSDYQHSR